MHAVVGIFVIERLATEDLRTVEPLFCLGGGTFANATLHVLFVILTSAYYFLQYLAVIDDQPSVIRSSHQARSTEHGVSMVTLPLK